MCLTDDTGECMYVTTPCGRPYECLVQYVGVLAGTRCVCVVCMPPPNRRLAVRGENNIDVNVVRCKNNSAGGGRQNKLCESHHGDEVDTALESARTLSLTHVECAPRRGVIAQMLHEVVRVDTVRTNGVT